MVLSISMIIFSLCVLMPYLSTEATGDVCRPPQLIFSWRLFDYLWRCGILSFDAWLSVKCWWNFPFLCLYFMSFLTVEPFCCTQLQQGWIEWLLKWIDLGTTVWYQETNDYKLFWLSWLIWPLIVCSDFICIDQCFPVIIMSSLLTLHSLVEATVRVKVLNEEVLCFRLCFLSLLWSRYMSELLYLETCQSLP